MKALTIGDGMDGLGLESQEDFADWLAPHLPALNRFATRLAGVDDREDVVQEALIRAWRRRSTFDPAKGDPLPWLLALVADRARRHRSRRKALFALVDHDEPMEFRGPDIDLERAIFKLSKRQREALDLYYFVGLDVAQVASVMRCEPGTVRATLHQARAALKALLGEPDESAR